MEFGSHLTSASTVSDDSAGEGAMTTSASPSSTSSHSIWMWKKTGKKHLSRQREAWTCLMGRRIQQTLSRQDKNRYLARIKLSFYVK